jgi:peptidoglycan/xylan/chitin deacetylase (PgdA/CDA1 family)/uncharacterized protein YjhX (UPF0386 family)
MGRNNVGTGRWAPAAGAARWLHLALAIAILAAMWVPTGAGAATGRIVATDAANVRACASTDCPVVATARLGDQVEITGAATAGYYPVVWSGVAGFVSTLYVNRDGQAPWFEETDPSCHQVAIIFNIGIGDPPSQTILNTLVQKQAAATMFPMGWWAQAHPDYLRQLDAAGFPIGTHGDQMRFLTDHPDTTVRQDTLDSIAAIEAVLGHPIERLHTPYADDTDNRVRTIVSDLGLLPVGWHLAAADYASWATETSVYTRVMNQVYPGAVIEFHLDGPATETSTARALPRIIDELRGQGYELVTVPELADGCLGAPSPETGQVARVVNTGGDGLNCRQAPTTVATRLTTLPANGTTTARGRVFNGWYPVLCGSANGWASATYLAVDVPAPPTPTPAPTPTPSPTPPPATLTGTVSNTGGEGLNCRSGPSTGYGVITVLPAGATVTVRGAAQAGWYPVVCGGRDGWVSAQYLTVSGPAPEPTPAPSPSPTPSPTPAPTEPPAGETSVGTVVNTGGAGLNCRSGPGTAHGVITVLPAGATVTVRGATEGGWVPVVCASRDGWVSAQFLSVSTPSPGSATGIVTTDGLRANCRVAPWGAVITSLANGTEVVVRGAPSDGWVPIRCANQDGWIYADLIRLP